MNYITTAFNFLGNASRENPFDTEKKVKSPVLYTAGLQTSFSLLDISGTVFTCKHFQKISKVFGSMQEPRTRYLLKLKFLFFSLINQLHSADATSKTVETVLRTNCVKNWGQKHWMNGFNYHKAEEKNSHSSILNWWRDIINKMYE